MFASFGSLSVIPWILFAQSSWSMDTMPGALVVLRAFEVRAEIQDRADVLDIESARRSLEASRQVRRTHLVPIRIDTVKSLDGVWIADAARRKARTAKADQLYVLMAVDEREVGVISARHGRASRLSDQDRERIRRAFLDPIQAGEFDLSIEQGVQTVRTTLEAATAAQPSFDRQDAVILTAILMVLAVYPISRLWDRMERSRGRRTIRTLDFVDAAGDTTTIGTMNSADRALPAVVIYPMPPSGRRRTTTVEAN